MLARNLPLELRCISRTYYLRSYSSSATQHASAEDNVVIPKLGKRGLQYTLADLKAFYDTHYPAQEQWRRRLQWAMDDLNVKRKPKVTILGDDLSGSSVLVSALLDDAFSSDASKTKILHNRLQRDSFSPLNIQYGSQTRLQEDSLSISAPWLAKGAFDLQELQIERRPDSLERLISISEALLDACYTSDLLIVVISDVQSLKKYHYFLSQLGQKRDICFIVNTISHDANAALAHLQTQLEETWPQRTPTLPIRPLIPFSSRKARQALAILESAEVSSSEISQFSAKFTASGVPQISDAILDMVETLRQGGDRVYQTETSLFLALRAAEEALSSTDFAEQEVHTVQQRIQHAQHQLKDQLKSAEDILGFSANGSLALPKPLETEGKEIIAAVMDRRLPWWRLPIGGADDVAAEVSQATGSFYRSAEAKLAFESGRLLGVKAETEATVSRLLRDTLVNQSRYRTSILDNEIAQLEERSTQLQPTSLIKPIIERRALLAATGGPIEYLQAKAQNLVLQSLGVAISSSALAYASYTTHTTIAATSIALSALGSLVGAWQLQRGWEKAKRRFFQNYDRVEKGLAYDLQNTAASVLKDQVFFKSTATIQKLLERVDTRKEAVSLIKRDIEELHGRTVKLYESKSSEV